MFKLIARFLFCGAAMAASYASVSFASPWANATSKPTGTVNGGAVVLIPFVQGGAVTNAKVDDGNGAAASLNFRNMDSADALDEGRLEGAVFDIPAGSGLSVEWRARLSAGVEAYVEIVNGPGVIDPATSYSATSEASATAECWNSAGTTTPIVSAIASVSIVNAPQANSPSPKNWISGTSPTRTTPCPTRSPVQVQTWA